MTGDNICWSLKLAKHFIISRIRHVAQFWQQVSPGITLELAEDWAYGVDMDVFGYNIDKYFEQIGMPGYLDN